VRSFFIHCIGTYTSGFILSRLKKEGKAGALLRLTHTGQSGIIETITALNGGGKMSCEEKKSSAQPAEGIQDKPEGAGYYNIPDFSKIIIDDTSGLYNTRYLQKKLEETFRDHETSQKPLSLIMIDIDHFRQINCAVDHTEGDRALRESGTLIKSLIRDCDTACRYGGDEFVIILTETDKKKAVETAKQIREAFQLKFQDYIVKITASVGVASYPEDAVSLHRLISAVDRAVYTSQREGRNRVTAAPSLRKE